MVAGFMVAVSLLGLIAISVILELQPRAKGVSEVTAVWQAAAAFLAMIPALAALFLAMVADDRAKQSEREAAEARKVVEEQAVAMKALARASEGQFQLLQHQMQRSTAVRLMVTEVPNSGLIVGSSETPATTYHLANFSEFPVFVESITLLGSRGGDPLAVLMLLPNSIRVWEPGGMLQSGETRELNMSDSTWSSRKTGNATLEYGMMVQCISPSRGREERRFSVRYAGWDPGARMEITPLPEDPLPAQ